MPYLLTAGNHPGSPASWIKTEEEHTSNAGITLPDTLMTTVTSHCASSSPYGGNLGINKMAHLNAGSMTIGRPLPRPLPPITDSFNHSTNELKFGGHRSKYASNSQLVTNHHGNREPNTNSHLNNINFATAPRNLNINSQSSMSHPNGLSALLNGRIGNQTSHHCEDDASPMSQ
jgi:hypothetical protein